MEVDESRHDPQPGAVDHFVRAALELAVELNDPIGADTQVDDPGVPTRRIEHASAPQEQPLHVALPPLLPVTLPTGVTSPRALSKR